MFRPIGAAYSLSSQNADHRNSIRYGELIRTAGGNRVVVEAEKEQVVLSDRTVCGTVASWMIRDSLQLLPVHRDIRLQAAVCCHTTLLLWINCDIK